MSYIETVAGGELHFSLDAPTNNVQTTWLMLIISYSQQMTCCSKTGVVHHIILQYNKGPLSPGTLKKNAHFWHTFWWGGDWGSCKNFALLWIPSPTMVISLPLTNVKYEIPCIYWNLCFQFVHMEEDGSWIVLIADSNLICHLCGRWNNLGNTLWRATAIHHRLSRGGSQVNRKTVAMSSWLEK